MLVGALAVYLTSYVALRGTHVLVRTGAFRGAADSRVFTTRGRWVGSDIVVTDRGAAGRRWIGAAFLPLIAAERAFRSTLGVHLMPPYEP